jgi:hypothetical protein
MTRVLKASGTLGLAITMAIGLHMGMALEGGQAGAEAFTPGHAHLGVLSILAIVVGFLVDHLELEGRLRSSVTGLYLVGQWLLPITLLVGVGMGVTAIMPTFLLWGLLLVVAMLVLTWAIATHDGSATGSRM